MKEPALPVAISALIDRNRILLIKRKGGDYRGLWGLPGGKIERGEQLSEAAVREIMEESGIEAEFREHLATVSEHLVENNRVMEHFLLHVCDLVPKSTGITRGREGELAWFGLDGIEGMKDSIIPSDLVMIERIIRNRESRYYDCVTEKVGDRHILRKFE
jgi:ADP-ribose pyrophosphatase YjhB (NUDIX family)